MTFPQSISGNIPDFTNSGIIELQEKLNQFGVVILRKQTISTQEFISFAHRLGTIVPFVENTYLHPEHPEVFVVSNIEKKEIPFGMDRVGYYWHSDSSFLPNPLAITMLHCREAPKSGGQTAFLQMRDVERHLGLDREASKGLKVRHEGKGRYIVQPADVGMSVQELLDRDENLWPSPVHPLFIRHPKTNEDFLYLNEGFSKQVLGWTDQANESLLRALSNVCAECLNSGEAYKHTWEQDDIVIWDNRVVIHRAYPADSGSRRLMFRIGVSDGPHHLLPA